MQFLGHIFNFATVIQSAFANAVSVNAGNATRPAQLGTSNITTLQLGIPPIPFKLGSTPWNMVMVQDSLGKISKIANDTMELTYPARCGAPKNSKCGSEAGMNARASPRAVFPADSITLGYEVFFPKNFEFTRAGKLPGFWIGEPSASGGDWKRNGGSARIMWRLDKGKKVPYFVAYLYIPTQIAIGNQKKAVQMQNITDSNQTGGSDGSTGLDVFVPRNSTDKGLQMKPGEWNFVEYTIKLNTKGKTDGSITVSINGNMRTQQKMTWRSTDLKVNGIMLSSWFGGRDIKIFGNATPQKSQFRNFWVRKNA